MLIFRPLTVRECTRKKPRNIRGFLYLSISTNRRSRTKYILYPIIFDRVARNDKIIVTRGLVLIIFAPRTVHKLFLRGLLRADREGVSPKVGTPTRKSTLIYQRSFPHTSPFFERGFFFALFSRFRFFGVYIYTPSKTKTRIIPLFRCAAYRTVIRDYRPIAYSPM